MKFTLDINTKSLQAFKDCYNNAEGCSELYDLIQAIDEQIFSLVEKNFHEITNNHEDLLENFNFEAGYYNQYYFLTCSEFMGEYSYKIIDKISLEVVKDFTEIYKVAEFFNLL